MKRGVVVFRGHISQGAASANSRLHLQSLTVHPAFRLDSREPVLSRWDASQIVLDVLFPDVSHGDFLAFTVRDRNAEDFFSQENAFGMVAKGTVTEISEERL
jgi:hypothetical protein